MSTAQTIDAPEYRTEPTPIVCANEDELIARALSVLESRVNSAPVLDAPREVERYLQLRAAGLRAERFGVLFLNAEHRPIDYVPMFDGTLSAVTVYPREIAVRALALNAAAVILHHNHPSGNLRPSRADEVLTQQVKAALALLDVRLLDHIVTSDAGARSMAALGLV